MLRDTIIAAFIGLAFITPVDTSEHPVLCAVLLAAAAWYLLTGTNPAHNKKRSAGR